ncbi:MAG TPA: serine hydrolase [Gemmatimonadaceae bacterium]|nr:serine hydrolase [Gemmatimonadaceae bacterium]
MTPFRVVACLVALTSVVIAHSTSTAQSPATPSDRLIGIWASETTFGPALRGELTVRRNGSNWSATISSVETRFQPSGDSIRFGFPGNHGQFRGVLSADRRAIRGFWIQPNGVTVELGPHDPGGLDQPFATPLTLQLQQRHVWRAVVVPVDDRFSLYLSVWREPNGMLVGAFRNPELNLRGGALRHRMALVGDSVIFAAGPDTAKPVVRFAAKLDTINNQIVVWWWQIGRVLALTRRAPDQAIGLFPRVPRGLKYSYTTPLAEQDGWKVARARDAGFDEARLERLVQSIADTVPTLPRAPLIHSLLIARKGKLVLEEYFYGWDRDRPHDTRSAAKTFASVMLGAAMMQGAPVAPETPITTLLSRYGPFANSDSRKPRITLAHLMTHSSGLACDDNVDDSPGNEGTMQSQTAQRNWWKYVLDLPMARDPGSYWAYCSGGMNLVGAGVAAATKTWLPEFFDRAIARPLQFGRYYFNLMPTFEGYTGGGMWMRPRDLLKFGQTYLDGGMWNGKRIVPKAWVTRSTAKHIEWPYRDENVSAGQDGYAWHLWTLKSGNRTYPAYAATGNGGQALMVVPELELAVVFTAGNYGHGGVWVRFLDDIVPNVIIPAIRR